MNMTQRFFSRVSALAAFALALTAFGPQAQAFKTRMDTPIGEITFAFDTVASVGISVRTKSRDYDQVASQSGGADFIRDFDVVTIAPTGLASVAQGVLSQAPVGPDPFGRLTDLSTNRVLRVKNAVDQNFAGGANVDDGHLNFDKGDITALTLKTLTDIQADLSTKYGEFTAFMRVQAYADPVLRDGSFYERVGPDDAAKRELGRDIKILDGFLSWDWDLPTGISAIGDLPFNLRVGKLTSNNWGESTFALNGIAASIVIDVPSARRAGAEIKEIIQPEYMVYGSIGLPFDISVDAYYQFHHTIWNLDVSGSPTATSDVGNPGNEIGGFLYLSSASDSGSFRRNCSRAYNNCNVDSLIDYRNKFDDPRFSGRAAEQWKLDLGETNIAPVRFVEADDQGQWGVRLSYYVDTFYLIPPMGAMMDGMMENGIALPGIEFNFSYQNVHSRVPYVRVRSNGAPTVTRSVTTGFSTTGASGLGPAGCMAFAGGTANNPATNPAGFQANQLLTAVAAGQIAERQRAVAADETDGGQSYNYDPVFFNDGEADVVAFVRQFAGPLTLPTPGGPVDLVDPDVVTAVTEAADGLEESIRVNNGIIDARSLAIAVCAVLDAQLSAPDGEGGFARFPIAPVGTETLFLQYNASLDLYYPEDIQVIGGSFNTTIPWLEWGLQAEVSWRPDMPLQQDTTEQLIDVAWNQCVQYVLGTGVGVVLDMRATQGGCATTGDVGVDLAYDPNDSLNYVAQSIIEADMLNFVIGTTALYNASNPVVNFLGADQAIILTEFNLVTFDDLPASPADRVLADGVTIAPGGNVATLACVSRSGTELPLGGILGLDGLSNQECQSDATSFGYTLLGFMDYNNVFGTAWRLRPSLAVRHAVSGNTPAPINSWREDTLTTTFAISAAFQNTWSMRMSYVAFFDVGSNDYNANSGNDSWSFNISYAF